MSDQQYPAWQTAIRSAQAAQRVIDLELAERVERDQQEQQRKAGETLAYVLNLLGVTLPVVPTSNPFTHDGWTWRLKDWDGSSWEYPDHLPQYGKRGGYQTDEEIRFTLFVNKEIPPDVEPEDWAVRGGEIVVNWRKIEGDWTEKQADLADALDEVQENYQLWQQNRARRAERAAVAVKPTLEQEFFALFERMVRKYQSHDGHGLDIERD